MRRTIVVKIWFVLVPFQRFSQFPLSRLVTLSTINVSNASARDILDSALYSIIVFLLLFHFDTLLFLSNLPRFFLLVVLIFVSFATQPSCYKLFILQFHPLHSLSKLFWSEFWLKS